MSVSNTVVKQVYVCNGVTTTFAIPFAWLITAQIKVYKITVATGERELLALTTDYTYSPNDITPTSIVTNSAFAAEFSVEIIRETSFTQLVDYINNGAFPAEDHEAALDKIVMMIQELGESQAAAILLNALDIAAGFDRTLPASVSLGILRANADQDAMEFITIEDIMDEAGYLAQLQQASDDAAAAADSAAAAADSAAAAEEDADAAAISAAEAAADAAAAVGASVSNRIQVIPYAPAFMGGVIDEEHDVEVIKLDIGNRVIAFTKMSQYFITGRPIKVGFSAYTPTNNMTSKYQLQMTATLVKNGVEISSTTNQEVITEETTVSAVASAHKVFSFEISPIGEINGVEVDANDGIKLEFKRIDASGDEDVELTRLLKQTFELSFA